MTSVYGTGINKDWVYMLLKPEMKLYARAQLRQWASNDPGCVRKVLYHCAQTMSLVRLYPFNLPLEVLNSFHAGITLWAVSGLLEQTSSDDESTSLHIDQLYGRDPVADATVAAWVKDGGSYVIGIHGVPALQASLGQRQILEQLVEILERMRVFGIAKCFQNVVLGMLVE